MIFCIRNAVHYTNEKWVEQAENALKSLSIVTKAFNNYETLIYCKRKIESVTAIGLTHEAQVHLHIASP